MANTKDAKTTNSTYTSSAASSSKCQTLAKKSPRHRKIKLFKLYKFVDATYREIRKYIPDLETPTLDDTIIMECINNYKKCFLEIYEKEDALEYFEVCGELAQNISRTLDLFKDISTIYTNMDEYYHRVCELLSIFIACELRLSVDSDDDLSLIASRIIFIIKRHLTQEDEEATRYNILLTLVYVPRLFNARQIVCNVFEEFVPLKPYTGAAAATPDKIYIMYIIIFYRWMSMKTQDDEKKHIIDMAEMFIKPMVSLCNNQIYVPYLPAYTTHRTATRTILCNLKSYQDLRTASIIDIAYKKLGAIVNLCDDDDVIVIDKPQETLSFSEIFAAFELEPSKSSTSIIKHELNTIIDSVDLTVDDETDTTECSIVMKYEKWLHNFQVMAKQFKESQTRLQRQNENRSIKVICLDSDDSSSSEEEELKLQALSPIKKISKNNKRSNGKEAQCTEQTNSFGDNDQTEDLFADNYPLSVTPIHCNADLELSEVEDAEDVTKLSRRILPIPLQTYESRKGAAIRSVTRKSLHNAQNNQDEWTTNKPRREKHINFSSSPLGPTSAYSKKGASLSQPTSISVASSEFDRIGVFGRPPTFSSTVTSTTTQKQGHIEAASSLFCGIFPSLTAKHFSGGDLFSSTTGRSSQSHLLLSPTGGFLDSQHKKRNKIRGLMQRRATLSSRSDFDDYMAALETTRDEGNNEQFKMHPGHVPFGQQFPQSSTNNSISGEVSNEPGIEPVPASSYSDYDIINRYQFQDEKLMKNCAVVIEPTPELVEYERKRDAMYNELLQKQRRKMELRAIEKLKEKERRRQEKEMKRDQYLREQRETMEKLQRMKINSPFNETESSDNYPKVGCDKEPVTERSRCIDDTTQDNIRLKETTEVEQQKKHQQTTDLDTSDTEQTPLLERLKRTSATTKQKRVTQPSRIRKRRQSVLESLIKPTQPSIGTRRISEIQSYSEKVLASKNCGGRIALAPTKQTIKSLTDTEVESTRAPSRTKRERRKSVCSKKLVEQTDSEIESESREHAETNSIPRHSPRIQRNMETDLNTDSEIDKINSVKPPSPVRGRPRKQKHISANKIIKQLETDQTIVKPESKENEAALCERTIVASIAESLSSPATIVVDKPLATSEQEEILETLEDLLGKETRLPKTVAASDESSSIARRSNLNVNSAVKMVTVSETSPDLEVIENIVINEIQREMDANREQDKERTNQSSSFQNIISDINEKSSSDRTRPPEDQTYFQNNKHVRSITKSENSPCKNVENIKNSQDEQHLQDTVNKTSHALAPLTATVSMAAERSTLPILISRVESLNNPLEDSEALNPIIESRECSILVTENILLSNGNGFIETSKTLDDNHMLPPLTSSLLTEVETSMIQADISDISPTSINIVIPTDEEYTTLPHQMDKPTPVTGQVIHPNPNNAHITSGNMSVETQNNEIQPMVNASNAEENFLLSCNNNGEDVTEMGSPPYEALRVSSDDDVEKQSTATDESHSIGRGGSDTSEGDHCARLTSGDNEKLDTALKSPTYEPLHVSSDDDEKNKSEVPTETSSKVIVIKENLNKAPVIPFKTKASLKFPTTKKCKIILKRVYLPHNTIASENHVNFAAEADVNDNVSPIPSPCMHQEDCIIRSENYSDSLPPLPEDDNSLEAVNHRHSPIIEEIQSIVIERCDENSQPLPTILKSSTSPKPKAKSKTVTFNPLAEVIDITPNRHYDNRSIFDRDETPPPEDFYRDHNYDRRRSNYQQTVKFRTPATRKHFSDDCYSNISTIEGLCNLSSSSSSEQDSEDDHEEIGIVLASSKGQEDIRRKNVQLQRVLLVPPDDLSRKQSLENVERLNDPLPQEKTDSQEANGGIRIDNFAANGSLPVYILSDEVENTPTSNQIQGSDEGRNVLVSTTYLADLSMPGNHLVINTVQNSMMSPSEHEVTSTQETTYQKSSNGSTIESDLLTSAGCSAPIGEKSFSGHAENSALLQNNQVDTTNHSPDMCTLPSNLNENNCIGSSYSNNKRISPSSNESTKARNDSATDNSGANEYCDRLSPSTTTDTDDTMPSKLEKIQNSKLSRYKAKEARKIQHNSPMLNHRNPFIVRNSKASRKLPNASRQQHEKESTNLDEIKNTSTSNSTEVENSKILPSVTKESQKQDNVCNGLVNRENLKMLSNNTTQSLVVERVEVLPKKKFVLIRPKPYTTQNPSTSANTQAHLEKPSILVGNGEARVKNSDTKKKCALIRPKPVDINNPSTIVPQATKRITSNQVDNAMSKNVKRNLNVIDFQEFSYSPPSKDVDRKLNESVGSNDTTLELQTMVNELLAHENKDEMCNDEAAPNNDVEYPTSIINQKDDAGIKDLETKSECKVGELGKRNVDITKISEHNQRDLEESKRTLIRNNEPESENAKKYIKCTGERDIEKSKKELKRKDVAGIPATEVKSNERHNVRKDPSKNERRNKEKTNDRKTDKSKQQKDHNVRDPKEIEDSKINHKKKDTTLDKMAREDSERNTNHKVRSRKQAEEHKKSKQEIKATRQESTQNKEIIMKAKINSRNDDDGTKVEESKKDKNNKDKPDDIQVSKTVTKTKDKIVIEKTILKDNRKVKDLKRSDKEKYNSEIEGTKKSKLEMIDSQKDKLKIDRSKKELKEINVVETDPVKFDDTSKERDKITHIHRDKGSSRKEEGEPNKTGDRKDESHKLRKRRRKLETSDTLKSTTSTRKEPKVKNKLIGSDINVSTRSDTIIAVKMIPFTTLTEVAVDVCEDTMDVGTETEVVKTAKKEIVGVKMIKVNEATTSSAVRSETPVKMNKVNKAVTSPAVRAIGQSSKLLSHSVENCTEEAKKINTNINSTNKAPSDCENIHISSSKSATTTKHNPSISTKDNNLYSITENSVPTESSHTANKVGIVDAHMSNSSSTSAATVHARKRRKISM